MVKHSDKGSRKAKKEARSRKNTPEGGKRANPARGEARVMTRGKRGRGKLYDEVSIAVEDDTLSKRLESMGLKWESVEGDGSCMFRAISTQLFGHQRQHQQIRKMVCDEMETNEDAYSCWVADKPYKRYIKEMRRDATYGAHLELVAFAHISKSVIRVVQHDGVHTIDDSGIGSPISDDDAAKFYDYWSSKEKYVTPVGKVIYLVYHTWEHYDGARNLNGPDFGLPNLKPIDVDGFKEVTIETTPAANVDGESNASSSLPSTPPKVTAAGLLSYRDREITASPNKSATTSPTSTIFNMSEGEEMGTKSDLEASCLDLAKKIGIVCGPTPSPNSSTFGSPPRGVAGSVLVSSAARAAAHPYSIQGRKGTNSPGTFKVSSTPL